MADADIIHCRQCRSVNLKDLGAISDADVFAGQRIDPPWTGGKLLQCANCGLGFRHPIRAAEDYDRLYGSAPGGVWVTGELRHDQALVKQALESRARQGRVLDVGCYDGALLASLEPTFRKFGVEASAAAAAVARSKGIDVVAENFKELATLNSSFDIICAVDVIEHVAQPAAFISTLVRLLSPGGLLIISTGCLNTVQWRLAGGQYWYCWFPEHISFISEDWGRRWASQAGLRLVKIQRFAYLGLADSEIRLARWNFYLGIVRSWAKNAARSVLGTPQPPKPGRRIAGRPGIFADHMILAFAKPE